MRDYVQSGAVARAAGVDNDVLARWLDRRYISPTIAGRQGEPHQFDLDAVLFTTLVAAFVATGFTPGKANRLALKFWEPGPGNRAAGKLSPDGKTFLVATSVTDAQVVVVPDGEPIDAHISRTAATVTLNVDNLHDIAAARFLEGAA